MFRHARTTAGALGTVSVLVAGVVAVGAALSPAAQAATTYALTSRVPVGTTPYQVDVDATTGTVYAANAGSSTVSVIDPATATVTATVRVGATPIGIGVDPARKRVYTANYDSGTVSVIDTETNTVVKTITVGPRPLNLTVDAPSQAVYVTDSRRNAVYRIDEQTDAVSSIATVSTDPFDVAVDDTNATVWVVSRAARTLTVLTADLQTVVGSRTFPAALQSISLDSVAGRAYVTDSSNTLTALSTTTRAIVGTAATGVNPSNVDYDSGDGTILVANGSDPSLQVFDAATLALEATVVLPAGVNDVDVNEGSHTAYVSAPNTGEVFLVGRTTTAPQTVTFTSAPPAHARVGGTYAASASGGGSGNPVTFTADPSSSGCTVLDNGDSTASVSFTAAGTCVLEADQAGDANYDAAPAVQQSIPVDVAPNTTYPAAVAGAGAAHYYRLDDTTPGTGKDSIGTADLVEGSGVTQGVSGAITGNDASAFDGTDQGRAYVSSSTRAPNTFTVQAWFRTTTPGGKILGFGNRPMTDSFNFDRHVYLDDAGHLRFGVNQPGANDADKVITTPGTYTDGAWHQVTASLSGRGMVLSVDGRTIATQPSITFGEDYTGFWRVGGDGLAGWPGAPRNINFTGTLDEVAIYPTALTAKQISDQYVAGGGAADVAPTAVIDDPSCADLSCSFDGSASSDPDGSITSYRWDFGDGTTSTAVAPRHTYASAGSYSVTLTVTDDRGSSGSANVGVAPVANPAPTAVVARPACAYLACAFDGRGSSDDGSVVAYSWDFGDGTTGSGAQPSHTYPRTGNYTVTLVVTDDKNAVSAPAAVTFTARANQPPTAAIPAPACDYLVCTFDGSAAGDSDGSVAAYRWNFDDRTTSTEVSPTHTFPQAGAYDVTLYVVDDQNRASARVTREVFVVANVAPTAVSAAPSCTYLACTFDASGSSDDSAVSGYAWTFGDGTAGTGVAPSHTFAGSGTYQVTLQVTDDHGSRSKRVVRTVTVAANVAPTAAFSTACTGLSCSFDATNSTDGDGTIVSYAWTFGDGTTGSGRTTTHTYASNGARAVRLVVTDNGGLTDSARQDVTVRTENLSPVATFLAAGGGLSGNFDGRGSLDPDGRIVGYSWDFGDGSPVETGSNRRHTYAADGAYTVTLTVTDNKGGTGTFADVMKIKADPGSTPVTDQFDTVAPLGWGVPTTGWGWNVTNASNFRVDGSTGFISVARNQTMAAAPTITLQNSTQTLDIGIADAALPSQGVYAGLVARRTVGGAYRLAVFIAGDGSVRLITSKLAPGGETVLGSQLIAGLTVTPATTLRMQFGVRGKGTTTLTGTVWDASTAAPSAPQTTVADSSPGDLQKVAGVGLTVTNPSATVNLRVDNYVLTTP